MLMKTLASQAKNDFGKAKHSISLESNLVITASKWSALI